MGVVVRTAESSGIERDWGAGTVRGDGDTGSERRGSLEQSLSAADVDLVSFKTP